MTKGGNMEAPPSYNDVLEPGVQTFPLADLGQASVVENAESPKSSEDEEKKSSAAARFALFFTYFLLPSIFLITFSTIKLNNGAEKLSKEIHQNRRDGTRSTVKALYEPCTCNLIGWTSAESVSGPVFCPSGKTFIANEYINGAPLLQRDINQTCFRQDNTPIFFGDEEMLIDHTLRFKDRDWNVGWSSVEGFKGFATMCALGIIGLVVSVVAMCSSVATNSELPESL
jgi:hypothetical protein